MRSWDEEKVSVLANAGSAAQRERALATVRSRTRGRDDPCSITGLPAPERERPVPSGGSRRTGRRWPLPSYKNAKARKSERAKGKVRVSRKDAKAQRKKQA